MEVNTNTLKVIGFDADDTLWVNEIYFRDAEKTFTQLLGQFETQNKIDQELFKMQLKNLPTYGYGVKGFVLSMVEMAIELSNGTVSNAIITQILNIGKQMIHQPIELLDHVEMVLQTIAKHYKVIVVTKGDLLDQQRKLKKSGLLQYCHHVEVLSEKHTTDYTSMLNRLDIKASEFLMVGNSLKSDVLPVLKIGGQAIHVPSHTTWQHETVTASEIKNQTYKTIESLSEVLKVLNI